MNTPSPVNSDFLRVTSIPYATEKYVIFSGVPLRRSSYRINSAKYIITIKSDAMALPVRPSIGQHWQVTGSHVIDTLQNGDHQLQRHTYDAPIRVTCTLPEDGEQLIQFIAKEADFKGIGEQKARALWEALGKDFHATLSKDTPEARNRLLELLSPDSVNALFAGYAKYANLSACNWMSEHAIPAPVQQRLLKYHDERSVQMIQGNPYVLLGFGMPFLAVDNLSFDVADDDPRRLTAAVEMSLRKEVEKGHTYTTQNKIRPTVTKFLGSQKLVAQAFEASYQKAQFVLNWETGTYHPTAQFLMESVVAKRLRKMALQTDLYDVDADRACMASIAQLPYELTQRQVQAVAVSLDNAVSCITGGAGTGKTTVLRTTLRAFKEIGYVIHAVALSGRAAMRLQESIGFRTRTIAGFLRQDPVESTTAQPLHLLVIDESSMIDLPTMYRLITHITPNVRIILTGDPEQLPPIGCGKILSDVVMSGLVANTTLDIVKRQESFTGIPEYSIKINQGIVPKPLTNGAIHFHETPRDMIAQRCTELFAEISNCSQVVAATKALVADINQRVQETVNPNGQRMEFELQGERFFREIREGDSVLFTQNNYEAGIQNGSLGTLVSSKASKGTFGLVHLDTGIEVSLTQSMQESMELGYCITLHKAQGSQFPHVIIALQKGRVVDRSWLYTAITRAESEVHIVGSASDFATITQKPSLSHNRLSHLGHLLSVCNRTPDASTATAD
ncbi:MAG: AAA family ATPase [Pseudomonadota bacterium]